MPQNYPSKKVLGVIALTAEAAVDGARLNSPSQGGRNRPARQQKYSQKRIGVIGTKHTIKSGAYEKELKKAGEANFEMRALACPLLVPLIEENWTGRRETKMILKKYLRSLKEKNIGTLILGCTHYPILIKDIRRIIGKLR